MSGDKKYEYTKAWNDHMETWGPHCGAPKSVYRGHLEVLIKAARADALAEFSTLHPASSWTEAEGPVLWWDVRTDPPRLMSNGMRTYVVRKSSGQYTHWSRIPKVELPK